MKFCHTKEKDTNFKIFTDLNEIKQLWDNFLPESHHLKSGNLLVFQESKLDDISFAYLVVEKRKQISGIIYLQLVDFNSSHYSAEILENGGLSLIKDFILKQKAAVLICGNLFRLDSPCFYFRNPEDQKLIFQLLNQFENQYSSNTSFSGILVKDIPANFPKEILNQERFKLYNKDRLMEFHLEPEWKTFDDYLNELSKKYKQRASKILKAGELLEKRTFDLKDFEKFGDQIEDLYKHVVERQMVKVGCLNKEYFQKMLDRPEKDFEIIGYFFEGKFLAFSTLFKHSAEVLEIHYIGFDFEANEKFALYFNILFDGIKASIERNIKVLKLGRTGYDAKASAGAIAVNAEHFYQTKRGMPSLFFKFLVKTFSEKEESKLKVRNPFKSRQMLESLLIE